MLSYHCLIKCDRRSIKAVISLYMISLSNKSIDLSLIMI